MTAQAQAFLQNVNHEKAWALPFDAIDPAAADDYFVYLRNNGGPTIVIHRIAVETTVTGTVEIHAVSGIEGGSPTGRTPVNKSVGGSAPVLGLTTGATEQFYADPDITGLTDEGILDFIALGSAGVEVSREFPEGIRLKSGQAVALLWDTSTGILTGAIHIYEE